MNLDKNLVKPYWYIDIETLVTILKVIKDLDEDPENSLDLWSQNMLLYFSRTRG